MFNLDLNKTSSIIDLSPSLQSFKVEVLKGLSHQQKTISPQFFYDERGSDLFDQICDLPEYYLTRSEFFILKKYCSQIIKYLGSSLTLIEFGSGMSKKTRLLLNQLDSGSVYAPVDISKNTLIFSSQNLLNSFPKVEIIPICADFKKPTLFSKYLPNRNRVIFFPGSTFGNLDPYEVSDFLKELAKFLEFKGKCLIGIDLIKDIKTIERAYNDTHGITARFNKNILMRMIRELGASLNPFEFEHKAWFNNKLSRVEMHLVSRKNQVLTVCDRKFQLFEGESIRTECSYKYSEKNFEELVNHAGFYVLDLWKDDENKFGVFLLSIN